MKGGKLTARKRLGFSVFLLGRTNGSYLDARNLLSLTHIDVGVVDELTEGRQDLLDRVHRRRRLFVPTQIHDHPSNISQKGQRYIGINEGEERFDRPELYDVVSTLGAVTYKYTISSVNNLFLWLMFHALQKKKKK